MSLKEEVLVNVVIPSKPLFSFFCRGNMKTKNESFCYNKWMKCVAITFCYNHMLLFFPLTFMRILCINSHLSFITVVVRDQNVLLLKFVLQRTVQRGVYVYIDIF